MNTIEYYQAEIDYRREQMTRDQGAIRRWRRGRRSRTTNQPKNRTR